MNKFGGISEKSSTVPSRGGVVVGRINKVREMLDSNGNVIDPKTKQIIKKNVEEKLIIN